MKVCSVCHLEKEDSDFYPHTNRCKACAVAYARQYYQDNKATHIKRVDNWRKRNPKLKLSFDNKFKKSEAGKKWYKKWYENNKQKICESVRRRRLERYKTDPLFKLTISVRDMMRQAIKTGRTVDILGCTFAEFKIHIEKQFTEGMTWDNFGMYGWHINHIKPLSWFNLNDPAQVAIANHYTNLQPMWAVDNLSKNNRYEGR